MIDFITSLIVTAAFVIVLLAVPAWAIGLVPGKGSGKTAPSDFSDQPEGASGTFPESTHAQIEH